MMAPGKVDYTDYILNPAVKSHQSLHRDRSREGHGGGAGKYREVAITQHEWTLNAESCSQVAKYLTGCPIKKGNDC